mgnify:CR=1 FL=1
MTIGDWDPQVAAETVTGNTTSGKLSTLLMALEMVTWEVSNTNQGLLPYIFLQVKHGDLHADEYSQA